MAKLWAGRTNGNTNQAADDFNSSLSFDQRMFKEDITGSIAHAQMLGKQKILPQDDVTKIIDGLTSILEDIVSGQLTMDDGSEDVHMFVEQELTKRIGDAGKRLHTARSRNDQVALDIRMYLRETTDEIQKQLLELIRVLCDKAQTYSDTIMPGYTHLQRAQPITFGHHLMAYASMLYRDIDRLKDARKRLNFSPIGCCALAGTTYDTDRFYEAELLHFDGVVNNSIDGVSDRDFCLELAADFSIVMMHLSRFAEEILLWTSWEFKFITLSDDFTTGSSIMPQKKNSDMAELVRGKTGRVYGDLIGLLTMMKGLPLAYDKDMQEDKEAIFDAADTVKACVNIMTGMLDTMTVHPENMKKAAQKGFINATDLADYLVQKGLPFRDAYKISGKIVAWCLENDEVLETVKLEKYHEFSSLIDNDVYQVISLENCVKKRLSFGGTSPASVKSQVSEMLEKIKF